MTTTLSFEMTFHSHFRVGAAYPNDGVDLTYDEDEPLPGDHLKGLMRAEARRLASVLPIGDRLVDDTFGTAARPSAWSWFSAEPVGGAWHAPVLRHRVNIDDVTHAATQDMLVASTSTYAEAAVFVIERDPVANEDPAQVSREAALLRLSARSLHHVGGWRRRGLGWVGVRPIDDPTGADGDAATAAVKADVKLLTGEER